MAFLYVTEYANVALAGTSQIALEPPLADYRLSISAGSTVGPAFQPATRYVRLHADSICSVLIGPAATVAAAITNQRFAANQTEYKGVPQGAGFAVANTSNT